jgi:hypothetical protein
VDRQQHESVLRRAAVHTHILRRGIDGEGSGVRRGSGRAVSSTARLRVSGGGLCGMAARGNGGGVVSTHITHLVLWKESSGAG